MRKGWIDTTIEELAEINPESLGARTPEDYQFGYIDLSMVNEGCIVYPSEQIKYKDGSPRARRIVRKGDILLATVRPNLKGFGQIEVNDNNLICSTGFAVLRCKEQATADYLYQYIFSDLIYRQIDALVVGSNYPAINNDDVKNLEIRIPKSLAEQKKIAAILRTWDDAIEKQQFLLLSIKKKRALIIQKAFSPQNTPLKQLSEIASIIISNVDKKSLPDQRQVSLCNYMDVFYNRYITADISFMVATASDREIQTYALQKGDAVFTKDSETPEEISMCASIEEDIPNLVCGYHLAIARPDQKKVLGTYLAEAINSPRIHHRFVRCANGATRFGLTRGDIDEIEIPVPSLDHQTKIISAVYECDNIIKLIQKQILILQNQKRGLMQKLLTGAWPVTTDTVDKPSNQKRKHHDRSSQTTTSQ